jgi:hypothetical protein
MALDKEALNLLWEVYPRGKIPKKSLMEEEYDSL